MRSLALPLLCLSLAAHADEGSALVAVVAISAHYDNAIGSSDAASQGAVTADLIRHRPAQRTGELLEFVPGMIVTQHSGDGKANQYFLRGFNLDHGTDFATFVDGMPVNMRTHAHGQGYADLNFVIPELVQRIDYLKGPYFADTGDFASAGAARLRLADRVDNNASVTVGRFGYRRALVTGSSGQLVYGVEAQRNDGPWTVPEQARKFNAQLRYRSGNAQDGYSITAMAYRNRWHATDQIPERAAIGRYDAIDPTDGGQSARYSLSYAWHRHGLDLNAYALASSLDLFSNFTYFLDDPLNGDQFQQSERRRMAGLDLSYRFGEGDLHHRIGAQVRYDRLAPVGLYRTRAAQRLATVREDQVREASIGLFVETDWAFAPQWRALVGLRADAHQFDVGGARRDAAIVSPKLSLIYRPLEKVELFANAGRGFHSNDARTEGKPLAATRGMELGARIEPLPGLQTSLALWKLDIDSELVFVGDAGDTEASGASRRHGVEWNNHYLIQPWLLLDLDLAWSKARFADGSRIPGSLERTASFGLTVREWGKWMGSVELRHMGPRALIEDGSVKSAASTLATARIGYRLGARSKITVDVFNLFNRRASDIDYLYASRLPGEPAEGIRGIHFHPVEPRSVRVTFTHAF